MKIIIIMSVVMCLCSCTTNYNSNSNAVDPQPFTRTYKTINSGAGVNNAIVFNNYILCKLSDGRVIILDSSYNINDKLSANFRQYNISIFRYRNDSLFCYASPDFYFIDPDLHLHKSNVEMGTYGGDYLYDDSVYSIYNLVDITLFKNKITNKTYGYSISNAVQAFKFNSKYFVTANYKFYSTIFQIDNPDSLFEYNEPTTNTEAWVIRDEKGGWRPKPLEAIRRILAADTTIPYYSFLVTFVFNNQLYTIFTTEQQTLLAIHKNNKLNVIDTVFKTPTFTNYPASFHSDKLTLGCNSYGLFVVKGNQITLIKFI